MEEFKSKEEKLKWIFENKDKIIYQKKSESKIADGVNFIAGNVNGPILKANGDEFILQVKAVINTTNVLDSHDDVHIKGIWNKSLKENKNIIHLQEHDMSFKSIIADGNDLKAYAKDMTWKELGYNFQGSTQALIFDSAVRKEINPFMFNQYAQGRVKNHSVRMQYVKIELGMNDEDYENEYKIWKKYIDEIVNRDKAEEQGYFFAVMEAKIIEGSAVPIGSNTLTPTLETTEPPKDTPIEPSIDTQVYEIKSIFKQNLKWN